MTKNKLWTREELLLTLNLYYKLPFGQFDQRNSEIIYLSQLLGRTPSSVAMQLSNLASLDSYHQERGVRGLRPPGKLAQELWVEAQNEWEKVIFESEKLLEALVEQKSNAIIHNKPVENPKEWPEEKPSDITEMERSVKVRLGQRFFRASIMANYRERCCICGMPFKELLIASHIIPWKDRDDLRLNPRNGLCLCALHDKAFDRGFLTIAEDFTVLISSSVYTYMSHEAVINGLVVYNARPISLPDRFAPEQQFLESHRHHCFIQ